MKFVLIVTKNPDLNFEDDECYDNLDHLGFSGKDMIDG